MDFRLIFISKLRGSLDARVAAAINQVTICYYILLVVSVCLGNTTAEREKVGSDICVLCSIN